MKLTGKCREDFEKWYVKQGLNFNVVTDVEGNKDTYYIPVSYFNDYPQSMQYGVYVDFFDSVGIRISIRNIGDSYWYVINYPNKKGLQDRYEGKFMSRPKARTAAIEKANEIHNSKV